MFEFFPGLRFNFDEDRHLRLKKYEKPEFLNTYRLPFPLEKFRDIESFYNPNDGNLAERLNELKKFEEVVDYERIKLMQQRHRANPELTLKDALELEDDRTYQPSNRLEEARMYALDDDIKLDLDGGEEENDDGEGRNADILGIPIPIRVSADRTTAERPGATSRIIPSIRISEDVDLNDSEESSTAERPDKMSRVNIARVFEKEVDNGDEDNETTMRRFTGLKVMEDPSEFAFAPSDSRFYRKTNNEEPGEL